MLIRANCPKGQDAKLKNLTVGKTGLRSSVAKAIPSDLQGVSFGFFDLKEEKLVFGIARGKGREVD